MAIPDGVRDAGNRLMDDQWATHIPLLAACVAATNGPVLELGTGDYSTPALHAMCLAGSWTGAKGSFEPRLLVSADDKRDWIRKYEKYRWRYHELTWVEDWAKWEPLDWHWDVALIDHGPAAARKETLARLKDKTRLIVLHDTEKPAGEAYGCGDIMRKMTYRYDDMSQANQTTVLSMIDDLSWLVRPGEERGRQACP